MPPRTAISLSTLRPCCQRATRDYATSAEPTLRTALFFPGHGVQRKGMLKPWLEAYPKTCKPFVEEMDSILGVKLSEIIEEGPVSLLDKTENAQPAIMATSVMILRVLEQEFGFETDKRINVTLGHSLGEYAALVAAGYLDFDFALKIVRRRGEIMGECTKKAKEETGETFGMMALVCEPDQLESLISAVNEWLAYDAEGTRDDSSAAPAIRQVTLANKNSKNQIVLSGSFQRIRELLTHIREFGGHDPRAVELKSRSAFHSPIMKPAFDYMKKVMTPEVVHWPGKMTTIANVTGLPFDSADNLRKNLSRQAIDTVLWWDSIKYLHDKAGTKRWLGLGPGKVGRNLVGKEVGATKSKGGGVWAITDPWEIEETMKGLEETESDATS
ncbi:hypothetical protein PMZ80_000542 [Knufia obscura]|uniref:[acyl-carrier-protein] S-malonyltransferase n=2 Tax=Knufia TaxID=430999 RepID=A0AAN8FDU2_9EURO|nr:hypothetical protein PMZ80_000542 [Knufia obscura]KAK5956531.1 hypothetical protein OHC33_002016 [Knufia fluminis]